MSRRKYTKEFKVEAMNLVTGEGYTVAEAARSLGINAGMLSRWRIELDNAGEQTAFPGNGNQSGLEAENRKLREEVKRLKMEREILKKAAAFFAKEQG